MKVLFTFLITLVLNSGIFSQWVIQKPLTYQTDITSVYFTNSNNGWAAADYGIIFNTTDGGANWSPISNQPKLREKLNSIFFVDNTTGYAVGYNGTIYKIAGSSTTQQESNTAMNLLSVFFTSPDIGYCSGNGGTILKTTNGGTTWTKLTTGTNYSLSSIYFTDSNTGYAVGGQNTGLIGIILKTTNAGTTWQVKYSGKVNRYLYSVYFANNTTGWACGWNGTLLKTTNSGNNWTLLTSSATRHLKSIRFKNLQEGIAVGAAGAVLKTTNGGAKWVIIPKNTLEQLNSIAFSGVNSVLAAGNLGTFLKSDNGGSSWEKHFVLIQNLQKVQFTSKDIGWIFGNKLIYKTTNGGISWVWKRAGTAGFISDLFFIDNNNGWIISGSSLFKTTNSGLTWTESINSDIPTSSEEELSYFSSIYFISNNTGWAANFKGRCDGAHFYIFKTTNSGTVWNKVEVNLSDDIFYNCGPTYLKVYFKNNNQGWIIGYYTSHLDYAQTIILYTTDGGKNWKTSGFTPNCSFEMERIYDITFSNNTNGFIVGGASDYFFDMCGDQGLGQPDDPGLVVDAAMIIKTINNGQNWLRKNYALPGEFPSKFFSISFPTSMIGYAVGTGILKTTDNGLTWFSQQVPVEYFSLKSVDFIDADNGWAVGDNGVILKHQKETIVKDNEQSESEVSLSEKPVNKEFSLHQNYPNPFNPVTKIKFDLPEKTNVNISIYNLLGERIAELVHREMEAGYHEVEFNANSLSSGIYFYRIDTDKNHSVKKMMLMK